MTMAPLVPPSRFARRLARDRGGALEGLPLYLLILGIVAVIGIAILLLWLIGSDEPPTEVHVEVNPGSVQAKAATLYSVAEVERGTKVTLYVYDQSKNPIEGAWVTATGANCTKSGETNGKGEYELDVGGARVLSGKTSADIKVTVGYGDLEDTAIVKVVRYIESS